MSKRLIIILALAFVVGISFAAYAEVQNVKVSGDLVVQGVARNNFNLSQAAGNKGDDQANYFLSQVRVKVDADLTDNVMATVRLINERMWGQEDIYSDRSELNLDLAYVTLKEFLYSPLTLTVGRQELKLGNALIVGNRYNAASYAFTSAGLPSGAYDLTERKAFDAIKAVLNYDPLVIEGFMAKITEGTTTLNDDKNLWAVNASYAINKKSSIQGYLIVQTDSASDKTDKIYIPGILYSASPIENLSLSLEGALQKGSEYVSATLDRKRSAYAIQGTANYVFAKKKMTPGLTLGYTYLSGDKNESATRTKEKAWNWMYEDQIPNNITNALLYATNCQVINVGGSIKPMEDVTLSAKYGNYRLAEKASSVTMLTGSSYTLISGKKDIGNALDLTGTYDYTEDVQLGLTWGLFAPGKAFDKADRNNATQLIGSMKVTF